MTWSGQEDKSLGEMLFFEVLYSRALGFVNMFIMGRRSNHQQLIYMVLNIYLVQCGKTYRHILQLCHHHARNLTESLSRALKTFLQGMETFKSSYRVVHDKSSRDSRNGISCFSPDQCLNAYLSRCRSMALDVMP